ncbi:transposase [Streptomyces sp. CG1]|uniref:transposase n=1 Tax=Streptomyces sp. CG1 TaxID=1287523 RepID=UPI0034E25ED3
MAATGDRRNPRPAPPQDPAGQREDTPCGVGDRRLAEHQGLREGRQGQPGLGWREVDRRQERHLICDNRGLVLLVMVTAANVTDRDAAKELLFRLALTHPEISIVWADSAYAGKLVVWAKKYLDITIKTVKRPKSYNATPAPRGSR